MATVTVVLEYEGKQYTYTQDASDSASLWPDLDDDERQHVLEGLTWYMWVQGNYSCDCNRLAFIARVDDEFSLEPDVPYDYPGAESYHFPCGETVQLVSLHLDGKDLLAPTPQEQQMDARARLAAIGLVGL